jgi:hypothetical protein
MIKKIMFILFLIILGTVLWPQSYDTSGGAIGKEYSNKEKCWGYTYEYIPSSCKDCFNVRYCIGFPLPKEIK